MKLSIRGAIPLLLVTGLAQAAPVHQHGRAEAAVVVDDATLTLSFRAPLMDILGVERAPESEAERHHFQEQLDRVVAPRPSEAAGCTLQEEKVTDLAALFPEGDGHHHADDHDHDHDHDHHHAHHQDLEATWTYQCDHIAELDAVTWPFLSDFPSLTTEVILLLPGGQGVQTLNPGDTRLPLE
ncbi:MAG: hypothetical protein CL543_03585 [Alcanivorax sp.]|nr:hypothetical protein [Alcanivorax sp.]MBI53441.1 hypothetical protein [Alcanivorax sp.]MBM1143104.1 DUF2796 domain-containing protein [Alcanivorax sp. ZXX171]MBU57935.1 hypothetical protein [Alcanivorax sp.]UWN51556.1 hypothetical protein ASALC70_03783 [Alcanivorax sp. ALC70]|tara:strand:- start:549 stop:1097 length:549 start_codon:yes stop_codon:yes gene_type:complete